MNSSNIIIIMLAVALILLAAGLVLYPALTVTLNGLLTTTVAAVTKNPCASGFEYFEGVCYKVVKVVETPDLKSCFGTDATVPPSLLASVNNETAIARVQRYINSKDVPGNYYVNLFYTTANGPSDGSAVTPFTGTQGDYLTPYIKTALAAGPNMAVMKYNGGLEINGITPGKKDNLLCQMK